MEEKPNYYAIIPANVRYDEKLKLGEKMMYGEITSLTSKTGECWSSNNYFAKLYKVSPQAISKWIKSLETQKYITISYEKEGNRIVKRIIKMVSTDVDRVSTDVEGGINTGLGGYQHRIKENNININNTSINNNKKNISKDIFQKVEDKNLREAFKEYNKSRKVKLTERSLSLCLKELNEWYPNNVAKQIECIEQSIMNGWRGLFKLKEKKKTLDEILDEL